jgi:poly-gamma-glutamate capsule biosynthesis protein CapA/YwtB (metallophosphatase superfamily)
MFFTFFTKIHPTKLFLYYPLVAALLFAYTHLCSAESSKKEMIITAVGDIMMGSHFPSEDWLPEDDGESLFQDVLPWLKNSDIVFGNLEGCLLNQGDCIKKCKNPETCYAFKMPEHYVDHLVNAGFNLMSIANNHIGDFGKLGIESTSRVLSKAGIHFAGVHTQPNTIFELNGTMIGFCAFSPNQATPDLRDMDNAQRIVELLNRMCDIVIVSVHAGAEGEKNRHVTRQTEIFYEEDRGNVYNFAHKMVDAGADVILGHGPHVTRAMELYKGRLIAYSLGNFCTYGRFNLKSHNGIAPILRIKINTEGEFIEGSLTSVFQKPKKGPLIDPKNRAVNEVIELTSQDFPETNLSVNSRGKITIKNVSNDPKP